MRRGACRGRATARLSLTFAALLAVGVARAPVAHTQMMVAVDVAVGPSHGVVIVGKPGAEDTEAMLAALRTRFLPRKVVLFRPAGEAKPPIAELAPFVEAQRALGDAATAYVCHDYACKQPTTDRDEILKSLQMQ